MARPLPEGTKIWVEHKAFQADYAMPSMEMAPDYYEMGYIISGARKCITPTMTYRYQAGDVGLTPPLVYHRTLAEGTAPYERILIKFTREAIEPFLEQGCRQMMDDIYAHKICHFTKEDSAWIAGLFFDIVKEAEREDERPYRQFLLQAMLWRILIAVWERMLPEQEQPEPKTPLTPPIMDAIYYMEKNYEKDPGLPEVADAVNFSPAYFSRLFRAQTGKAYSEYLDTVKLRHASELLVQTDKSIMKIAQETGYCHGNYFSERFKRAFGMTPRKYRLQYKEQKEFTKESIHGEIS